MAINQTPPTDQRAGVKPISFVLNDNGSIGSPVTLNIRPEDMSRTEPTRATIHQSLGTETNGWADEFGEGLPTLTISGHTGWRVGGVKGEDGVAAFHTLNDLIVHDYNAAKQAAINNGNDPAEVKLLFIDTLNDFTWTVLPTSFVLRRSRSRPLFLQYNIVMQALSTNAEDPTVVSPFSGDIFGGIGALDGIIGTIDSFATKVSGLIDSAVKTVNGFIGQISKVVSKFVKIANNIFKAVNGVIKSVKNGFTSIANNLIGIAQDIASVGVNLFRTISAIQNLPSDIKADIGRVASAFNEVSCIFSNSLRPRKTYDSYEDLYGASNCSSTTGGSAASPLAGQNIFGLLKPDSLPISLNTLAQSSISIVRRTDPVLSPMPLAEMTRHIDQINAGITLRI